ncbi:Elongation of very long chain fatty acids protein 6 [Hondaea fermentalgiana]|uniref:Elongation of fatty acids protein n=1 Tax=Hondaea fermentalgiana TaxID=2315210 RepID=A0A2R5GJ10_9STRA|nr:Elongation of very long chain fatty acids protein 6 [Hondaea fermentalgiana]|eukprot:GBG27854.1 Elongation of very long chain fatty acids protein 6 [Hondaea fermentalgiana]
MDEVQKMWKTYEPLVLEYVAKAGELFQREDVLMPKKWRPTGDWQADALSAWDAAWNDGTVGRYNETHYAIDNAGAKMTFPVTWAMKPELKPLYPFDWEDSFDGSPLSMYMRKYYEIPLICCVVYLVGIFLGRIIMSKLPAMDLTPLLVLWNLGLSVFSTIGLVRTVPHLIATIEEFGLYHSICAPVGNTFGAGAVGLWSFLFIISKIPELVDTVFIVLRKKPLVLLHWYHHFTVLLYVWQSYAAQSSAGIYFIAMNYTVHSVMYFYYACAAMRMWPRWIPRWTITLLQLAQMVLGIWICVKIYQYKEAGMACSTSEVSFKSGVVMYFSYFLLFLQILYKILTYDGKKKTKAAIDKKNN